MFSIVIPWKSGNPIREESLKNLLNCLKVQEFLSVSEPIPFELVIVEQVTIENNYTAKKMIQSLLPEEFAGCKYIQLLSENKKFNKSWCMNVGLKASYWDHIIFMDAESLFGKDYIRTIKDYVLNTHESLNKIMFCWDRLICLPGKDNPITRYITPRNTLAMGGIWYANKGYFLEQLGGMCENFVGYGAEDNDIYERAILAQKNIISMIPYTIVHQYHDWQKADENAEGLFDLTRQNAFAISQRLKAKDIGNSKHPTLIDISDLKGKK